jgi:hypothetical protein
MVVTIHVGPTIPMAADAPGEGDVDGATLEGPALAHAETTVKANTVRQTTRREIHIDARLPGAMTEPAS